MLGFFCFKLQKTKNLCSQENNQILVQVCNLYSQTIMAAVNQIC